MTTEIFPIGSLAKINLSKFLPITTLNKGNIIDNFDYNIKKRFIKKNPIIGLILKIDNLEMYYLVLVENKKFWIRTKAVTQIIY